MGMLRLIVLVCSFFGTIAPSKGDGAGRMSATITTNTRTVVLDAKERRSGHAGAASEQTASGESTESASFHESKAGATAFSAALTVRDAEDLQRVLQFGTVDGASDAYEHGLDVFAPPPPPTGFYAHIFTGGDRYFSDFRAPGAESTEWEVRFRTESDGQPISLEWDPADFPAEGDIRLLDGFDLPLINVDMRQQSQFVVPAENTVLKIVYRPVVESVALASPADGAANRATQDTLKWRPLAGYTSYHVQVAATVAFSSPLVDVFSLIDTSHAIANLAPEKTYFWRVRANKPGIWSAWSSVWRFTTGNADGGYPFKANLTVRDAGSGEAILRFGTADDASDAFDTAHDLLAPPSPPDGFFDARFETLDESFLTDIRATGADETQWELHVQEGTGGRPISLTWNPSQLPSVGNVRLTNVSGGSAVHIDMKGQSTFSIPNDVSTLQIVYGPEPPVVQRTIDMAAGWNLIGLPVDVDDASRDAVLPSAMPNTLFRSSNGYKLADSLQIGEGYWIRFQSASAVSVVGRSVLANTIPLSQGWNLISGLSCGISITSINDPGSVIVPNTVFEFDGVYAESDSLHPGRGYWVRASAADYVSLACDESAPGKTDAVISLPEQLARLNRLDFFDGVRGAASLFFGNGRAVDLDAQRMLLPPIPPAGAFDVRFEGNRRGITWTDRAASFGEAILLQVPSGSVVVSAAIPDGGWTYTLEALVDGQVTHSYRVENGARFRIDGADRLRLAGFKTGELPTTLELEQNYPNPFNPVTNIRYGLPKTTDVKLTVYNVLGQRMLTLVDEQQEAGWHEVKFDGTSISSGIYYYILEAGGSTEAKQLVLVK